MAEDGTRKASEVIRVTPFVKSVFDLFLTKMSISEGQNYRHSDGLMRLFESSPYNHFIDEVRSLNPDLEEVE